MADTRSGCPSGLVYEWRTNATNHSREAEGLKAAGNITHSIDATAAIVYSQCADQLEALLGLARYESTIVCPDSNAGRTALHERLQDGWDVVAIWGESNRHGDDGATYTTNHIALRRAIR